MLVFHEVEVEHWTHKDGDEYWNIYLDGSFYAERRFVGNVFATLAQFGNIVSFKYKEHLEECD